VIDVSHKGWERSLIVIRVEREVITCPNGWESGTIKLIMSERSFICYHKGLEKSLFVLMDGRRALLNAQWVREVPYFILNIERIVINFLNGWGEGTIKTLWLRVESYISIRVKGVSHLIIRIEREVIICPNGWEKGTIKHIMSEKSFISYHKGWEKSLFVLMGERRAL
jgi:hypothetical protein